MQRLEFIGHDAIRRDPMTFLEQLRAKYPNSPERWIQQAAAAEFEKRHPRHQWMVVHLFGEDILADDVTTIAAWPDVDPQEHGRLLHGTIDERRQLIDPPGLSRTYVWRQSNEWVQEVTDHDAKVLRDSAARGWFRDIDKHGPWVQPRTWDFPVKERFEAATMDDAQRFVKDITRQPQWRGR